MTRNSREQTRRLNWLTEAQAATGWGIILILVALLGTIYLRQASQIAAVGRHVQIIQINLADIKRSNAELEKEIAEEQSLDRLQAEAIRLGFLPAGSEDIEYLIVPDYPLIDEDAEMVETAVSVSTPTDTFSKALWLHFRNHFGSFIRGEARE